MKSKLSAVIITKNAATTLAATLSSVQGTADEILVVDSNSTDETVNIALSFRARVINHVEHDFGKQKRYAVAQARNNWVLIIDSDEVMTADLAREIAHILDRPKYSSYLIPFQTFLFGRELHYGGETYRKLILFDRRSVTIKNALLHEEFLSERVSGETKSRMLHYSYRSLGQMVRKFTGYALRDAHQKKMNGERTGLKKIFFYPPHMFWSRFVKDKGYRDGPVRIVLDIGFAYMEFLTYLVLPLI